MKVSILSSGLALLAQSVSAAPTPTEDGTVERANIVKRATITDVASLGYAMQNGGTTGGKGGVTTTVSTLAQFSAAADNSKNNDITPRIIVVSGTISGAQQVRIGSNKTIIGLPGATFDGIGLFVWKQSNVIVRNIISKNVLADNGDGITIQASKNVWVDHCEFYSDLNHDKDYYDGLVDVSHGSEWVTLSNTYMHDHWKASLIGHSDNNAAEDTGHLHVTQCNNHWFNIGSRTPSLRYGTGHIYNSYFENMNTGIDTRDGAQILVQSSVFVNVTEPIAALYSDSTGYANVFDTVLGIGSNTAPVGTLTANSMPYSYTLLGSAKVKASVVGTAGATL
ncbi:polysaccharide lyase family 1 protein, partial [Tricladium varicosporioides]